MAQQQPFRTSVDDDEEDQATPEMPKSFVPDTTPKSFIADERREEPRQSVFSRVKEALSPAKTIHASGDLIDIGKKVWDRVSEPLTNVPTKFAEEVSKYINPNSETKGVRGVGSAFLEGLGHAVSGLSSPLNLALTASGIGEVRGIPGSSFATKALSAPVIAEGTSSIYKGVRDKDLAEGLSGGLEAGLGILGAKSGSEEPSAAEELPIRQSVRTDLGRKPLTDTTPQQDQVAISLTKDQVPRTPTNISDETGIPKSSIRRTISEIKKKTSIEAPKSFIPDKPSDATQFADSVKALQTPIEESDIKQPQQSSTKLPPDFTAVGDENTQTPINTPETEDKLYNLARERFNMGKELPAEEAPKKPFVNPFAKSAEQKPTAVFKGMQETGDPDNPMMPLYDIQGGKYNNSTVSESKLNELGIDIPETPKDAPKLSGDQLRNNALSDKMQGFADDAIARIKKRGTFSGGRLLAGLPADDLADFAIYGASKIAKGVIDFADWSKGMLEDFGDAIKPHLAQIFKASQDKHTEFTSSLMTRAAKSQYGDLDNPVQTGAKKLFNSLVEAKGANLEQQGINKVEQAKRFQAFDSTQGEGVNWAKKAMSAMKGEYDKVDPGEKLGLSRKESASLFNTVKNAKIPTPEKIRGITALFKLMNGEEIPQNNELEILDNIFGKHLSRVSGPGASGKFDVGIDEDAPKNFTEAGERLRKSDDFLTKLANFSSKSTRAVLGFHVPGTALSFHGFNEAIRNTLFGPDFNPFKAAGRFADSAYYLARPSKAQAFLDLNAAELGKAIDEGGLKAVTGDIGQNSLFKGNNIITKGFNALTSPKPLFGQVIPALKLKGYQGLLEQYEKSGMSHSVAAKTAGEAVNNIFGGLNLHELERNSITQKLFRAAALAPDWLESNVRIAKGMASAIKHPMAPQNKVYMTGIVNFLGSYVAMNVINAINNNGKFMPQNDIGHEFDIATGKDSAGRTRYFSPYGTSMDMFRVPLEIAHAAVEGNAGKAFSDMRSRASEPFQFMTDLITNTDYAGRSLYNKTKYGKDQSLLTQGANITGDAASHFAPIGIESGINLAQDKISPEEFATQVLQMPFKYKTPDRPKSLLSIRKPQLR